METKAIIFDADGVIIQSEVFSNQYTREFDISIDEMLPFFKGPFTKCLIGESDLKQEVKPYLENWKWEKDVDEFLNYWFEAEHKIDEKIVDVIKKLKQKGIKCYLGTNQEKHRTEYMREKMGFGELFDYIFSSAYLGHIKPEIEFFEKAHKQIKEEIPQIKPEEIMFWDDSINKLKGGEQYGFNSNHYKTFEEFQEKISHLLR